MEKFGIGQPVRRLEDQRFITGTGQYTADITLDGQTWGAVVRSPHAHAAIRSVDTGAAKAAPGVLAVLTSEDYKADGLGTLSCLAQIEARVGVFAPPRPALADGRARHVGDPVAFVVAETRAQAIAAAEMVEVDYDMLPAAIDLTRSADADAPKVWDQFDSNLCFSFEKGDRAATDAAFAATDRVVGVDLVNNRLVQAPIETRAAIGAYDAADEAFTLHLAGQAVFNQRGDIAGSVFGIAPDKLRVIVPDVGGGFGSKNFVYPEYVLVLWAARRLGRPVKWVSERTEAFLTDAHGRDQVTRAELALDADGRFQALRVKSLANMGAYLSGFGPLIPTNASWVVMGGAYVIPHIFMEVDGIFTNTVPVDAYRGAGRPEASYIIERLVDVAAAETGIDPIELRRRNFMSQFPHKTSLGLTVDCGAFEGNLDRALDLAGAGDFPARRAAAREKGRLRGLGVATYLEITLGAPAETSQVRFDDDGGVTLLVGTHSNGQGHQTAYVQLVSDTLGLDPSIIRYVQADTGQIATGGGHGGSRTLGMGGVAMVKAAETVREKGRALAAHLLDAGGAEVEFKDGLYTVSGTNRSMSILELARAARDADDLPDELAEGLSSSASYTREGYNFPNGCHVCEVEVDRDTGAATIVAYTVVDDFGRLVNPMMAAGQAMGGTVQGIGQALLEHTVYDTETGQLLSGSFMDYTMPRADDLPPLTVELNDSVPTTTNPLGVKGSGEAGATGAPPAVVNAVVDALKDCGITHLDMPLTHEKLWRAINGARK
jgi:carbon-monoxide dehydrogenase large subunit